MVCHSEHCTDGGDTSPGHGLGNPSTPTPLFELGTVASTPGAIEAMEIAGIFPHTLLDRHVIGDWGDVCEEDRLSNDLAVKDDLRIMSVYRYDIDQPLQKLWVITEWDRSVTTILKPSEY